MPTLLLYNTMFHVNFFSFYFQIICKNKKKKTLRNQHIESFNTKQFIILKLLTANY